ncbi:hypothetical protein [Streptomyces sp. NBC_00996]|uniref:hypothetical protein n=1 Tax=Streptomyces sp. NBC_00996 TaxID=2903710 RepID=UPI00386BBDA2
MDKTEEMGIDWWEDDRALSSRANHSQLKCENRELRERLSELERASPREET